MSSGSQVVVLEAGATVPEAMPFAQACEVTGVSGLAEPEAAQAVAAALRRGGAVAVVVLGSDGLHWLDAEHARGWIAAGEPSGFGPAWSDRLAQGHVPADAALLAWPTLPLLSWGDAPPAPARHVAAAQPMGLYAIVDRLDILRRVLDAGVRTAQLRIKRPAGADAAWESGLLATLREGLAMARDLGATLFVNDHWRLAAELDAAAVHLGQEDLLALGDAGRAELQASGVALGISSHAMWELARARALSPRYIACGPVWPTTTKDMPWRPQGLDNLAWWCRTAGVPVVAIGGILTPERVRRAARAGADGVCVLRGLGADPRVTVPALQEAFDLGRSEIEWTTPAAQPHPTLGEGA
ncbi:MAG: thiamine phosphate synthase [Comamonadaceae bacterium]|nr:MAG: thiamine phosphate synthase [Comamonadaceae bacterium]